mmetsp:Transcript_9987/g.19257  ORF Transcript_9987/g.19257 Transcript_9987/m.19257 type:complete len:112 (-) Transcript_9987:119-454(-)
MSVFVLVGWYFVRMSIIVSSDGFVKHRVVSCATVYRDIMTTPCFMVIAYNGYNNASLPCTVDHRERRVHRGLPRFLPGLGVLTVALVHFLRDFFFEKPTRASNTCVVSSLR